MVLSNLFFNSTFTFCLLTLLAGLLRSVPLHKIFWRNLQLLFVQITKKKVNCLISHQPVLSILHDICTLISCIKSLVPTQISQTHLNNSLLPLQIKIHSYSISPSISDKFQFPISPALDRENSQFAQKSPRLPLCPPHLTVFHSPNTGTWEMP